jgi:GAF domain-containing protein
LSNQQFAQALRKEQQLTDELDAHRAQLEKHVAERTTELERRAVQLEVAAEIARATTSVLNLDTLLNQAVTLIRQRFDLYYVGLFLLDETRLWAELRAGTGAVGSLMLEQGHRLGVGGNSMVGWCTLHAQPSVSLDVGEEIVRFDNPLLPDTRSEAALPLIARGRVIGALDVQSVAEAAFPEESVAILQTLAGQIAVAIDNARLLDEVQASLAEAHAVHRQYLREAWAGFAAARAPAAGFRYVAGSVEPDPEVWLPAMTDAQRQNRVVIAPDEDGVDTLSLPIVLRGETIGVLGFKKGGGGEWTDDDVAVAQAVADQVALSLENVRLFDEAQRRARREGLMRELADKMRRTADANTILETAVQGLGRALGSARAFVRLGVPSAE